MSNLLNNYIPERRWWRRVFPLLSCFFRTSQPISEQNFLTHILMGWSVLSVGGLGASSTKCETSRSAQLLLDLVGVELDIFEIVVVLSAECRVEILFSVLRSLLQWWFLSSHPNQCSNRAETSTLTQHSSGKKRKIKNIFFSLEKHQEITTE